MHPPPKPRITRKNENEALTKSAEAIADNHLMAKFIDQVLANGMISFENIIMLSKVKNLRIQNALTCERVPKKGTEQIELFRFSSLIEKQMVEILTYKSWLSSRDQYFIAALPEIFESEHQIEQKKQLNQNFPRLVHKVLTQTCKKQTRLRYFHETVTKLTKDLKYSSSKQFQAARQTLIDDREVLDNLVKMSSKNGLLITSPDKVARVCKEVFSQICISKAPFYLCQQQASCLIQAREYQLQQNITSVMSKINQHEEHHLDFVLQYMQPQTYHLNSCLFRNLDEIEQKHISLLSTRRKRQIETVWNNFKSNIFLREVLQNLAFGRVDTHQIDEKLNLEKNLKLSLRTSQAISKIYTNTKDLYYLKLVLQSVLDRQKSDYFDTQIKNISQMINIEVRATVLWIEHINGINQELQKSINQFMGRHSIPKLSTKPVDAITNLNQIFQKVEIKMKSGIDNSASQIPSNSLPKKEKDHSKIIQKQSQSSKKDRKVSLKVQFETVSICIFPEKKFVSTCSDTSDDCREISTSQLKITPFPKEQQFNLSFSSEQFMRIRSDYARISQILKIYESTFIQHASLLNDKVIEKHNIDEEALHALKIQKFIKETVLQKNKESKSPDKASYFTSLLTGNIFQSEDCIQKKLIIECLQKELSKVVKFTRLVFRQDPKNKSSYHEYIDEKPNLLFLARTVNNRVIGAFLLGAFSKAQENTSLCFLFAAFDEKINVFRMKKAAGVKAINYDDFYIIFGNSDIRLRPSEGLIFSNLGIATSSFEIQDRTVHDFIGMNKAKEVGVKNCEFHQVYFVDE